MKQAILITAYHHLDYLRDIADCFDSDFDLYVHIDRKCREPLPDLGRPVEAISNYTVAWGSEHHLWAIHDLLRAALRHGPYAYYHLMSGQDLPVRTPAEFKAFFTPEKSISYLEHFRLPHAGWPDQGGLGRVKYYWVGNQWSDIRHGLPWGTRFLLHAQRKLRVDRLKHGPQQWWGGGTWCSLTHEAASCLGAISPHTIHRITRFTHCAEEVVPHTLLLNQMPPDRFESRSLRYFRWQTGATGPDALTADDFDPIMQSSCFFARKFVPGVSDTLRSRILAHLRNQHPNATLLDSHTGL